MVNSCISVFIRHVESDKQSAEGQCPEEPEPEPEEHPKEPLKNTEAIHWINNLFFTEKSTPTAVCERTFLRELKDLEGMEDHITICAKQIELTCKSRFYGILSDQTCFEMESSNQLKAFLSIKTEPTLRSVL
jgi:hypothetical protein